MNVAAHTAVVASLAYRERLEALPEQFEATLVLEPQNRYFMHAVAVHGPAGKIGYVAPEAARSRYDGLKAAASGGGRMTCRARRAGDDRTAQGAIAVFVDLSAFPLSE